jgi:hypothetical protein
MGTGMTGSGGFQVLTSEAPAQDAVMIGSGRWLAASARDWLRGGDIAGLRSLAATLFGQAGQLADRATAGPLVAMICTVAVIVDNLASALAGIENALEDQAHTASRYGVRIGTDRLPPPAWQVPPGDAAAASELHWTLGYQRAHAQAMAEARRARQQAARRLAELHATLGPPRQSPHPPAAAGGLTIGQFLTGLSGALAGPAHSPNGGVGSGEGAARNGMTAAGRPGAASMS